jgi:hypothetical protein
MPDRWEEASTRLRQLRPPRDLWDRIEDGPQLPPLPPPRRTRVTTIVAALGIFAIAAAVLWAAIEPIGGHGDQPSSQDVVRVPPLGAVSAIFLEDGRPAFVVHHEDGSVSVIDAFSSDPPWGILEFNGWCASSREFVDMAHGARFDEYGAYELGPAPSGLATFAFTPVSMDDRGDPASISIGGMVAPAPKAADAPVPSLAGGCRGTDRDQMVTHTIAEASVIEARPTTIAETGNGWVAVRGTLHVATTGMVQLCRDIFGTQCGDGTVVHGVDGIGLVRNATGDTKQSWSMPHVRLWFGRIRQGLLEEIAVLPPRMVDEG